VSYLGDSFFSRQRERGSLDAVAPIIKVRWGQAKNILPKTCRHFAGEACLQQVNCFSLDPSIFSMAWRGWPKNFWRSLPIVWVPVRAEVPIESIQAAALLVPDTLTQPGVLVA
jgi:hypothetical protein